MKDVVKFGLILMAISAVAAASLALTYNLCKPLIDADKLNETKEALSSILPAAKTFSEDRRTIEGNEVSYFTGESHSKTVGVIVSVSSKGYGGPIDMLVGVDPAGKVTGVKILKISDTPGLGLKANDAKYLSQYIGRNWGKRFMAKKDIQAISGATITSQAVADGVSDALRFAKVILGK
jgi:electron transport complex protein RnfG